MEISRTYVGVTLETYLEGGEILAWDGMPEAGLENLRDEFKSDKTKKPRPIYMIECEGFPGGGFEKRIFTCNVKVWNPLSKKPGAFMDMPEKKTIVFEDVKSV